jgi:hypothetical protein
MRTCCPGVLSVLVIAAAASCAARVDRPAPPAVPPPPGGGAGAGDLAPWIAAMPTLDNGLKWMPGVPGGIPDTTLTAAQMTAPAINAAIAAASGRGSPSDVRVVELPPGTYAINGTIVPRDHVVLRGAGAWGAGRTRLNFSAGGGVASQEPGWPSPATVVLPPGGNLPAGSRTVEVSSAAGFQVGDLVQLDQLDDLSYVAILDAGFSKRAPFPDGPYHGPLSPGGFRSVASLHQVTAVAGTTLTFDPPTRLRYDQALGPECWRVARRGASGLWWFGLERLSIAGPRGGAVVFGRSSATAPPTVASATTTSASSTSSAPRSDGSTRTTPPPGPGPAGPTTASTSTPPAASAWWWTRSCWP